MSSLPLSLTDLSSVVAASPFDNAGNSTFDEIQAAAEGYYSTDEQRLIKSGYQYLDNLVKSEAIYLHDLNGSIWHHCEEGPFRYSFYDGPAPPDMCSGVVHSTAIPRRSNPPLIPNGAKLINFKEGKRIFHPKNKSLMETWKTWKSRPENRARKNDFDAYVVLKQMIVGAVEGIEDRYRQYQIEFEYILDKDGYPSHSGFYDDEGSGAVFKQHSKPLQILNSACLIQHT